MAKALKLGAPARAPMPYDPDAFLAKYGGATGGVDAAIDAMPDAPAAKEEPGILEAGARAVARGATMDFADEIGGAFESMFTDKTYAQARDESRAKFKAAEEAHPFVTGLGQVIGGVGAGLVTGGAAGAVGKLGARGVAALAGAEGAVQGIGASEGDLTKGEFGTVAKDAAIGGAVGTALGAVMHKATKGFIDTAEARHTKAVIGDLTEGATATQAKRFAGDGGLVEVLEADPKFMSATRKGPKAAMEVTEQRLNKLGAEVKPIYQKLDAEAGHVNPLDVATHLDGKIEELARQPGMEAVRDALGRAKDNFVSSYVHRGGELGTGMPTQEVRQWVTRLLKQTDVTIGSLNQHEAYNIKAAVHDAAHEFLQKHLGDVAEQVPGVAEDVAKLRGLNKQIAAYAKADALMEHVADRALTKKGSLRDIITGNMTAAATTASAAMMNPLPLIGLGVAKAAGAGIDAGNRAATSALAKLVKATRSTNPTKALVAKEARAAIEAGVPLATVRGLMKAAGSSEDINASE